MEKGTGTRSGLLWEIERILSECENKPQILVMENVTQVHGLGNNEHFKEWQLRLEELGYMSYWDDLIATDFQIPQTRNRTFMISILGEYNYNFPKKKQLKLCLGNLLEKNVSEKYYLNDKMKKYILNRTPLGDKGNFAGNLIGKECEKSAGTLTTKGSDSGSSVRGSDTLIIENMSQEEINEKIYLKIKNATEKGYLCATDGDGVDISSRMESHRGTVQKGMSQTITTMGGENVGVVIKQPTTPNNEIDKTVILGNYSPSNHESSRIVSSSSSYPTVKENHGTIPAVATEQLIIRKLTPRECFRLMGLKDCDIDLIMENQTQQSCYHLAGDSIVTTCLMALFSQFYNINWLDHFNSAEWWQTK